MTDTVNLGLPFIEGSQAQKHVTHNEALRILDAAIQIAVLDLTLTAPPASPAEGDRHVVGSGATGAWAGQTNAIATWQDGAWAFLAPHTGWCIWSVADDVMYVFDGMHWRDLRDLPVTLDNAVHVGVNTTASSPNLLSVKSNAALLSAINIAGGGTGDARLQISKESASKTASVFFSDAFSGRAEFGLVGSDAFKLKVSPDGSAWAEALSIDQGTGGLTLPRGVAFAGIITPSQITASQNDYNPTGLSAASVVRLSTDATRQITGLAGAADGRLLMLRNAGSFDVVLKNASTLSTAANRFAFGADFVLRAGQGMTILYDATLSRWLPLSQSLGSAGSTFNSGRLIYDSATSIKFLPYNGDCMRINGAALQIPAAGIAGGFNTGVYVNGTAGQNLANATLYYVYAFLSAAGVVTMDFSTTGHATSATAGNVGTEIKSGDDARTLIGMVYTSASGQFVQSATNVQVLSWFNRRDLVTAVSLSNGSTSSSSYVTLGGAGPVMLNWSDGALLIVASHSVSVSAGYGALAIGLDGANPVSTGFLTVSATGIPTGQTTPLAGIAEGLHTYYLIGAGVGGTLTANSNYMNGTTRG